LRDVVIIGGGHNGLVCAFYLAAAGLTVTVLERRSIVGGAAVTEEFHPGFRNSTCSYTVSLLNPKVIRDLDLANHGLRIVERKLSNFLPLPDGRYLKVGAGKTKDEVAKFSPHDAERLADYDASLSRAADFLRTLILRTPPNIVEGQPLTALSELIKAGRLGWQAKRLGLDGQRQILNLLSQSAGDMLDQWFESDPIKAILGFDGVVGTYASPYTPGSAYVLLHHCFGEVNGRKGLWGHAIGGMGAITQAIREACESKGVDIRTDAPVREVLIEGGYAIGAVTEKGEIFRSNCIVSNLNPKLLYQQLIDPTALPHSFKQAIAAYRCGSGTFRMNVALSELPDFSCLPGIEASDHHSAGIVIAPSLAYMERAFFDARLNGWSKAPIVEMLIPSTLDDSLAPKGQHVASLFCQHVAPTLPGGRSWDDHSEEVADLMIETVDAYAPNFKRSIIARQSLTPLDLERTFGLTGGDIFHGALDIGQIFSARPILGNAAYRGPIPGLYMCGSGTHPGGGVTGAPGHNAAHEILRDLKFRRRKTAIKK